MIDMNYVPTLVYRFSSLVCRCILLCGPALIARNHSGDVRIQSRRARRRCRGPFMLVVYELDKGVLSRVL